MKIIHKAKYGVSIYSLIILLLALTACTSEQDQQSASKKYVIVETVKAGNMPRLSELQGKNPPLLVALQRRVHFLKPLGGNRYEDITRKSWRMDWPDGSPDASSSIYVWGEPEQVLRLIAFAIESFDPKAERAEIVTWKKQDGTFMDALSEALKRQTRLGRPDAPGSSLLLNCHLVIMTYRDGSSRIDIGVSALGNDPAEKKYALTSVPQEVMSKVRAMVDGLDSFACEEVAVDEWAGNMDIWLPAAARNAESFAILETEAGRLLGKQPHKPPHRLPSEGWHFNAASIGLVTEWSPDARTWGFHVVAADRCVIVDSKGLMKDVEENLVWRKVN